MNNNEVYTIENFKEYLPLSIDISDKERLIYSPPQLLNDVKKKIQPTLMPEELYLHMKDNSLWKFDELINNKVVEDFYRNDCISLLKDTDFQSFNQYGKLTNKIYKVAKNAYEFDFFLRNILQGILEKIEVYLKKSVAEAITLNYDGQQYIFDCDCLYYSNNSKYSIENKKRQELVMKTKYHIAKLILEKQEENMVTNQIRDYGVVLPWTVCRLMTFGNLSSFFVALQPEYRNKVADHISDSLDVEFKISATLLLSWSNALRYLRNVCSHNSHLYQRIHQVLPKIHNIDKPWINQSEDKNIDKQLIVYFLAMKNIFRSMSKSSQSFWNSKLREIENVSQNTKINMIEYGFLDGWLENLMINTD